jgi:hypothetical protein
MGNEAFEELEEPEQFEDPDLKLPEGLTKEALWADMERGDYGGEMGNHQHFVPPNGMFNYQQYDPYEFFHQPGPTSFNGFVSTADGFVSTTVNGAHGGFVNWIGHFGLMNGTAQSELSVNSSTVLHNGVVGEDSSSQSPASPLNGMGSGSASATLLSPLTDPQTFTSPGLITNGMAEFDIGEYLHFDDGENVIKVEEEEDIYGTIPPE